MQITNINIFPAKLTLFSAQFRGSTLSKKIMKILSKHGIVIALGVFGLVGAPLQAQVLSGTLSRAFANFPVDLQRKIKHVIILYKENRCFDSQYGSFPGANGLAQATPTQYTQLSQTGGPIGILIPNTNGIPGMTTGQDMRFTSTLPNAPYDISPYVPDGLIHGDVAHAFYLEQYQINNGVDRFAGDAENAGGPPMSKFAAWSSNPGLVLGHYDESNGGEGVIGQQFVMCDNAFHSAFGCSYMNHQWLIAARTPVWPASANPPSNLIDQLNGGSPPIYPERSAAPYTLKNAQLTADTNLTGFLYSNTHQTLAAGDYWAVNTLYPIQGPAGGYATLTGSTECSYAPTASELPSNCLPLQTYDTIGDRLTSAGISWAWYSGGWRNAKKGQSDFLFQYQHQPFAYFAKYALATCPTVNSGTNAIPGVDSPGSAAHLLDEDYDFYPALESGSLPTVCFVKPIGENNSHPGYASVKSGQGWTANIMTKIMASPIWESCVVFIMYDEHGGIWDHVQPPRIDVWGPGLRVPLIVASPFAKRGVVDHNQYETVSLLAFLEGLYNMPPLNVRDSNALPPVAAFTGQPDLFLTATSGVAFSYQIPAYNRPTLYTWTGGAGSAAPTAAPVRPGRPTPTPVPSAPGLRMSSTGLISGTPTATGETISNVTVTVQGAGFASPDGPFYNPATGAPVGTTLTYQVQIRIKQPITPGLRR